MSSRHPSTKRDRRDPDMAGAEAAMHRAAQRARRRAQAAKGAAATDSSAETSDSNRTVEHFHDPRALTFSQAQGYEAIPGPLNLKALPREARVQIWNAFYESLQSSVSYHEDSDVPNHVVGVWADILASKHLEHDILPLDELRLDYVDIGDGLRSSIENLPFNKVFDLIQFILRHSSCPADLAATMKGVFSRCRLAYTIDEGEPATIVPSVTPEEGLAVVEALNSLRTAGLDGAASHLRQASEYINAGDWPGSIRESIHAVEAVARRLDSKASKTLRPALTSLEKNGTLHPALKDAFNKLYGYTSDEQGIRHARLKPEDSNVAMDEAVFMLGACASFASYLRRKHAADRDATASNLRDASATNQPLKRTLTVPSAP